MAEDPPMRSVSRTTDGWVPPTPARWNWAWLAGGIAGAAGLVAVLLTYPGSGCRPAGGESVAAATGPGTSPAASASGGPARVPASPGPAPTSPTPSPGASQP